MRLLAGRIAEDLESGMRAPHLLRALTGLAGLETSFIIVRRSIRSLFDGAHCQIAPRLTPVRLMGWLTWIMGMLLAATINPALAEIDLEARCSQLIRYYDRYGASRTENSDGARNMTRIGADIDCTNGRYEVGIEAMEKLLRRKRFPVPPPAR